MQYKTNFKVLPHTSTTWTDQQAAVARGGGTKSLPGGGRVAILELGGGFVQSSLDAFADSIGMPRFTVKEVSTDGVTANSGDETQDASVEVQLDIQRAVGRYFVETGKVLDVTVLWGSDIVAVTKYFADNPARYDVLSISWGADEVDFGQQAAEAYAVQSARAAANGQTILAAAGDNSSSDGGRGANVDLPSADVNTIACGGTAKQHGQPDTVWGDGTTNGAGTGGGYSKYFARPAWQPGTNPERMTPDICDIADPNTGWPVYIAGGVQIVGGTSAVAPFLAGLIAAIGPKQGSILPKVWANPQAFTETLTGSNGQYKAGPGPTPCTGLGTVNTSAFVAALSGSIPVQPPVAPVVPPVAQRAGPIKRLLGWLSGLLQSLNTHYTQAMNDARERDTHG